MFMCLLISFYICVRCVELVCNSYVPKWRVVCVLIHVCITSSTMARFCVKLDTRQLFVDCSFFCQTPSQDLVRGLLPTWRRQDNTNDIHCRSLPAGFGGDARNAHGRDKSFYQNEPSRHKARPHAPQDMFGTTRPHSAE